MNVSVMEPPKTAATEPAKTETRGRGRPSKAIKIAFNCPKEFIQETVLPSTDKRRKDITIYNIYPRVADWRGRAVPDEVNPRSHDKKCLHSTVARQIEETLENAPEDFVLANRGISIIASSIEYKNGKVELTIADPEFEGLGDGASSDAVIGKVQREVAGKDRSYADLTEDEIPESLKNARVHLEILVGLSHDRDRIAALVEGRNTSRQVKNWSISDFTGKYDWLKEILENEDSPFKNRIGYEENAPQKVTVLDVISMINLFHASWDMPDDDGKTQAPIISYASKGKMDARLQDEGAEKGFKALSPIIRDILSLHEFIYANFEEAYDKAFKNAKLGRRNGIQVRPITLPLTNATSNYVIPTGFLYPLLASHRALVSYKNGQAVWKTNPFEFFKKHGDTLIRRLIEEVDEYGSPNAAAKKRGVWTVTHTEVRLLASKDRE